MKIRGKGREKWLVERKANEKFDTIFIGWDCGYVRLKVSPETNENRRYEDRIFVTEAYITRVLVKYPDSDSISRYHARIVGYRTDGLLDRKEEYKAKDFESLQAAYNWFWDNVPDIDLFEEEIIDTKRNGANVTR